MAELVKKYQQYDEYKDSGVEWLGEIPAHWEINRHKYVASFTKGKNPQEIFDEYSPDYYPYLSMDSLRGNSAHKYAPLVKNLYLVSENQPLIIWDGSNAGEFVRGRRGILSSTMAAAKLNCMMNPNYYWYLCVCIEPEMRKHANGMGIPHVNGDELKNISLVNPSLSEQSKIASFLDFEIAQIDTLIEKQQTLIKLLKEKRQAIISHAVTKGLNPDAPTKNSGVEWLGEVPEDWEVCKIQYYAKIESGHTPSKTKEKYWENCNIPWISLNDSKQLRVVDYISDTAFEISELGLANSSARILPKHSVVFTRDASIGLSAITTKEMAVSQHIIAWLPIKQKLSPEFLLLVFYGMEKEFDRYTFGSTIKTIGMDNIRSLTAAFPSLIEQKIIVEQCFGQLKTIDKTIEKSDALLMILRERRTALISAAVAGKIDVRSWRAPE